MCFCFEPTIRRPARLLAPCGLLPSGFAVAAPLAAEAPFPVSYPWLLAVAAAFLLLGGLGIGAWRQARRNARALREEQARQRITTGELQAHRELLEELVAGWARELIRENPAQLRASFEQAPVGIAHVDLQGGWLRANEKLCAIVGCHRKSLFALNLREIIHPDDLPACQAGIGRLLAGAGPNFSMEMRCIRRDGSPLWVNLTLSLARAPAGEPEHFIFIMEDIQYRKEAEFSLRNCQELLEQEVAERTAELLATDRDLRSFTFAASHDLKAPLGRINSFSSLLEKKYRNCLEGEGVLFLDLIRRNSIRMAGLIEDLLAHSQIEQKTLRLHPLDLQAAVRAAVDEQAAAIRESGAEVRLDLPALHWRIQANAPALAQALRNLLENALKYAGNARPPTIEIGGEAWAGVYRLWVRDNGIGFDMAYHDRIFEIFRRLHTYEEFPGSGVGLAIVKKAMDGMGGRVWAESTPGRGATFYLELPRADASQRALLRHC